MSLTPGTRLGPYEIIAAIGAGGMGEVYRARDARLHRDVAIKVLPESQALGADQRARFERETQAVAALSHPNVLAIFDTGDHEGQLFAVTELLEGDTLRAHVKKGPLPPRKAIDYAVQIAHGLAAAHDKHLVHRDLKPENIFILHDGRVKILDFGLARQVPAADGAAETVGVLTGAGAVMGTVGYMAPEQVRGDVVDARADVFAFGTVLYEMLTGQRAFKRDTAAETMTAILREEPADLSRSGIDLPLPLDRIIRHCLEKSPQRRFQSAHDVAFALESLSGEGSGPNATSRDVRTEKRSGTGKMAIAGLGIAAVAAAAYGLGWWRTQDGAGTDEPITIGTAAQVTADEGLEIDPALSPDGKMLAYAAGSATRMRVYIRQVAGGRTLTLSDGKAALEFGPRWSPDGSQILFRTFDGVFVASALGGTTQRVSQGRATSAAWAPDGKRVMIARDDSLSVAAIDGSGEQAIARDSALTGLNSCDWSPNGEWIACSNGNYVGTVPGPAFGNIAPSAIVMISSSGGPLLNVTDNSASNQSPVWAPDGRHLFFVSNREGPRDIYSVEVPVDGRVVSAPNRITTGLNLQSVAFAAAAGKLVYVAYSARANIWSMPVPKGAPVDTSQARPLTTSNQVVEAMRVSPDQKWLLYDSTLHLNAEVFRIPLDGGTPERLTTDPADDFAPDLSPDGREVAFHSWRSGSRDIYIKPLDGPIQTLTATPAQESYPRWSRDGQSIVFHDQERSTEGLTLGTIYIVRRNPSGGWSTPVAMRSDVGIYGDWIGDGSHWVFPRAFGIEAIPTDGGEPRVIYAPGPDDPKALSLVRGEDGGTLLFKSINAEGQPTIWSIPVSGGRPRLLVRFTDPARASIRGDFTVGAGRLFFTFEDRQADIWVADINRGKN